MQDNPGITQPALVAFQGERKAFTRLLRRGMLLELVTAGFYRFWLATNIRRHLWSNTVVAHDPFEYLGTGRELLIGFLFALAILAPFYLFYFAAGLLAESLLPFASTPLIIAFYFLSQFAAFRARRYRLTRTVWRGLRFRMEGSGIGYMFRAIGWGILVGLTLGAALPWREAALERYKMERTSYGSLQGSFVGTGWQFFKDGWALWLVAPFAIMSVIFMPFWWGAFRACFWRWKIAGIRIGPVSFSSKITPGQFYGRYWAYIAVTSMFGILFGVLIWIATALLQSSGVDLLVVLQQPVGLAAILAAYIPFVMLLVYVQRIYFIRDIWQRLTQSVEVQGLDNLQAMAAQGAVPSAMGESLGDSFDIGAF